MALIDDIRLSLRVTSDTFDAEVETYILSTLFDLERVGVDPRLLVDDDDEFTEANPGPRALVKTAVIARCKQHFGYDNEEADRFGASYERIAIDLAHSRFNVSGYQEGAA